MKCQLGDKDYGGYLTPAAQNMVPLGACKKCKVQGPTLNRSLLYPQVI